MMLDQAWAVNDVGNAICALRKNAAIAHSPPTFLWTVNGGLSRRIAETSEFARV
jgi:hypothetical protein